MLHLDTTDRSGCTGKWSEDCPTCNAERVDLSTTREE